MLRLLAGKRDGMWNERSQTFKKSERMSAPNVKKIAFTRSNDQFSTTRVCT